MTVANDTLIERLKKYITSMTLARKKRLIFDIGSGAVISSNQMARWRVEIALNYFHPFTLVLLPLLQVNGRL